METISARALSVVRRASPAVLFLVLVWGLLVAVRVTAPSDLLGNDQMRPAHYTLDIVRNGAWILQRDVTGDIASKPPLYTWCAAMFALAQGEVTRLSLYGPTALAILATTLVTWRATRGRFGDRAAIWAGTAFLCSLYAAKHVALARTDALFCLTVTLAALAAFRAWEGARSGWSLFWLACALATLTKGPTGVLLALFGLVAVLWERRRVRDESAASVSGAPRAIPWADHVLGLLVFFTLAGGWFLLAWHEGGSLFIEKVIGKELVGHATRSIGGDAPFEGFYKPTLYFVAWFAPWCVATFAGLWTVLTRPSADAGTRRFERFLACWFVGGLLLFSVAPHQRPDLLLPLIPAAAMLAGREIDWWLARVNRQARAMLAVNVAVVFLLVVAYDRHAARLDDWEVVNTRALGEAVAQARRELPGARPMDIYASFGFQYYMGVHIPRVSEFEAARALQGEDPVLVAVRETAMIEMLARRARLVAVVPDASDPDRPLAYLFTNVPEPRKEEARP